MKQEKVQSFWFGEELSQYEIMCIRSFLAHGHGFDLYSYTADLEVPEGCNLLDAAAILPQEKIIFYQSGDGRGSVALFANMFRYKLLLEKGGWWVDLDVVCQTDKLPRGLYEFGYQDDGNVICNAIIKVPARDRLMARCLERAEEIGAAADWGQTGPKLLTEEVRKAGLEHFAKPATAYYPYYWTDAVSALDQAHTGRLKNLCKSATFIHLWSEILRRSEINKQTLPRQASFIGYLFEKFCGAGFTRKFTPLELCSDRECLAAAFAIRGSLFQKAINRFIASRHMHNTKLYIRATGQAPNYVDPATYTEKMQCRKLFDRNPAFGIFCDKLQAHKYAVMKDDRISSPEFIWTGSNPHEIPFDELPVPYVVKANHRSGSQYVVRNESHIDKANIVRLCESWLKEPHGQEKGEWGYSLVNPCVQVERLLPHAKWKPFPDHYEISVFSGRVEFIQHITSKEYFGRFTTSFDRDWNQLPVRKWVGWAETGNHIRDYLTDVPRPARLDEMIAIAEAIADDIDHLRVDVYCIEDTICLGELTVYPGSGYDYPFPWDAEYDARPPRDVDHELGAVWKQKQMPAIMKLASVLRR